MRKVILKQELKQETIQLWEEILKKSIVNEEQLCNLLKDKAGSIDIKKVIEKYPMNINPYYLSLVKKENDAIWRQCIPDVREIDDCFGFDDPLHEEKDS